MTYSSQAHDAKIRKIGAASQNVLHRGLPPEVKTGVDNPDVMLPAQVQIDPCLYQVQTGNATFRNARSFFFWHSSFGKGAITATGLMLQPHAAEGDFMRAAPYLDSLDPCRIQS